MRWALIGASDIAATQVLPALRACGESPVIVCSSDVDRAKTYAQAHDVPASTTDLHAALESGAEAAYVSSTNEKHFDQAMSAIDAGLHVLCEKPLALAVVQAQEMVDAATRAGVVLATNHHLRNSPVHQTMRLLLEEGTVGQPLAVRVAHAVLLPERLRGWRLHSPEAGSGVTLDITVHDVDTIRFVTGMEPTRVTAVGANQGLGTAAADAVMTTGLLGDGVLFSTHDAFTVPHAVTGFEVHGTAGSLIGANCMTPAPVGGLSLLRDGVRSDVQLPEVDSLYSPNVEAFVSAVRGEGQPIATGDDGRRSLEVALAVLESLNSGRTIDIDLDTPKPARQETM